MPDLLRVHPKRKLRPEKEAHRQEQICSSAVLLKERLLFLLGQSKRSSCLQRNSPHERILLLGRTFGDLEIRHTSPSSYAQQQ